MNPGVRIRPIVVLVRKEMVSVRMGFAAPTSVTVDSQMITASMDKLRRLMCTTHTFFVGMEFLETEPVLMLPNAVPLKANVVTPIKPVATGPILIRLAVSLAEKAILATASVRWRVIAAPNGAGVELLMLTVHHGVQLETTMEAGHFEA